jgi:hypothetical protein
VPVISGGANKAAATDMGIELNLQVRHVVGIIIIIIVVIIVVIVVVVVVITLNASSRILPLPA